MTSSVALLGRHVGRSADGDAGARQRAGLSRPGDPEVGEIGLASRADQDVLRLDVAVDRAGRVRMIECVGDRREQRRNRIGSAESPEGLSGLAGGQATAWIAAMVSPATVVVLNDTSPQPKDRDAGSPC